MIEYKGYKVGQADNNHVMITKDGKMVLHSQCEKEKTEDELKIIVDIYIGILSDKFCEEMIDKEMIDEDEDSEV